MSDSGVKERSGFLNFVYNPVTGAWFTRTPSSWLKIGIFYLVYYSALAAFFAGMLSIFIFAFTDKTAPGKNQPDLVTSAVFLYFCTIPQKKSE